MGTLNTERVSSKSVTKFDQEDCSLLGAGTPIGFSYFVVSQVLYFIPTTFVLQFCFALEFAARSWHPNRVLLLRGLAGS